ncbi:MAG TPA: AAA family ATPase, partial [Microterricola sp.]
PGVTQSMVTEAQEEVGRLREKLAAAEAALRAAQDATVAARTRLDAVDEEIAAQSALVSRHDLEITQLTGQSDSAASRLAAVRGEVLRQQNASEAASERRAKAERDLGELEAAAEQSEAGETDLDEAYEIAQREVTVAEGEIERLRDELHVTERERDALAAKVSALSRALDVKDGSAELLAAGLPGVRGLVAESVQVTPGFEAAVAAALGTLADAVLVESRDAAHDAVAHAGAHALGRVELVIAEPNAETDAAAGAVDWPELDGITSAAAVITAPPGVLGVLAHVVIADDLAAARGAAPRLNAASVGAPVTIVTRDGDVLTEYVLRGGSGGKQGRIELLAERDAAAERLHEVTSLIERARFALTEQRVIHQNAKTQSQAALATLREFDSKLATQTEKLNRARVQFEASVAEFDRLGNSLTLASARVAEAEAAAHKAKSELETARARPRPLLDVSTRDMLYAELEQSREAEIEARLSLETARERARAEEARREALTAQREQERAAAEEAARRAVIRRRQVDAATAVVTALPEILASVDASVAEARVELTTAEAKRASENEELATLRREEAALRERLGTITENVHGLELQIYEKKLHLSSLLERAGSELGLGEDVLIAEYGPDIEIPSEVEGGEPGRFDKAEQKRRLEKAERTFAQLGRVNPLALEEFAALEQRHLFLSEQLTDLTKTRADLLTIIEEIDEKMQTIFAAAFEDTKEAFGRVFPILFPGGTGSITLTNPDDMLTTGIEVSVKPAGKKIERLSLLSGGERSLAAVALLIAIFKARPSPFYIMDEVEAALDDANLGRLLTIFQDLRESSQLIVITHQKRTMEIADALYGVSMRQDGVSAVVGQRVASERGEREELAS